MPLVFTVRTTALRSVFRIVTIALGTVAPDGSVTVPRIVPVVACASTRPLEMARMHKTASTLLNLFTLPVRTFQYRATYPSLVMINRASWGVIGRFENNSYVIAICKYHRLELR